MILRTIGQGGMGAVYQAKDMKRNTICAVKEMSLSSVPANEQGQAVQNFLAEATILSRLNHPNLPAFTDFFSEGERHFLVMEFIDGKTLEDMLEENGGPFPERRVLGWARQLCDVLEYLHSQRPPVIFRDLKPGNIMLRNDGRIKLIDFGIARLVRRSSSQDTQLLGTPGFAPPEQYGTAQTDERSDIYSLAMTLFQLLTDTLPEKGFGLPDVRAVNPDISPTVARALEKAASLEPEDRYQSVAVFRRALFRVGAFPFENGREATTPEELAELCSRYPDEAADYLFAGEIESWFQEIGSSDLARTARRIRTTTGDPEMAVEKLVQAVMGPGAHLRTNTTSGTVAGKRNGNSGMHETLQQTLAGRLARLRNTSPVLVRPTTIDFGEVYPGLSAPMLLTVAGNQGAAVKGTIRPVEQWIIVDQTSFDGMSTLVRVRVDSTRLRGSQHYSGTIVVTPDEENPGPPISVKVEVEVMGYTSGRLASGTHAAVAKDATVSGGSQKMVALPRTQASQQNTAAYINPEDEAYKVKYGQPGGWDPLRVTATQRKRMRWGLTFAASFMMASLFYLLFSHLPLFKSSAPLPPNPWFAIVLPGILLLAVPGALLATWESAWRSKTRELVNRACSGLVVTLTALSLGESTWHSALHTDQPALHLFVMLLLAALAAMLGTSLPVSTRLLNGYIWAMKRLRLPVLLGSMLLGAVLGVGLTMSSGLFPLGIVAVLVGAGVALALIFRADHLISHP